MIRHLSIRNYILIDQLELDFPRGLNIVTGETGAGKSILMGALDMISGERADPKSLRNANEKCVIESWFSGEKQNLSAILDELDIENDAETIIRREILPGGKSRAFVNDTPVTLDSLKKIGNLLLDIHGQQDTHLLAGSERQIEVLDILAGTVNLKAEYQNGFKFWKDEFAKLNELKQKKARQESEMDFKLFAVNELDQAGLKPGEQEILEQQISLLKNAERIKSDVNSAIENLENGQIDVTDRIRNAGLNLEKLGTFSEKLGELGGRLKSTYLELDDILDELKTEEEKIEHNPQKLEVVDERLSLIFRLQKKYFKNTVESLIEHKDGLQAEFQNFEQLDEEISNTEKRLQNLESEMLKLGNKLGKERQSKLVEIQNKLLALIADMGMANARFEILLMATNPQLSGLEKVSFQFSANPGQAMAELKNTASGGEFSRLMLAVKCLLAGYQNMPTLIFDEIDTGISGEIALKVGKIIKKLAQKHQVFSITHSAQMASQAEAHWFVYKQQSAEKTMTGVKLLSSEESTEEIAKMISGSKVSETSLKAARELMEQ